MEKLKIYSESIFNNNGNQLFTKVDITDYLT